jgi:multiple sugar transport system ATP-binding protein
MVFQENALFPFMSVRRNIAFPLEVRRTAKEEVDSRVEAEARVLAIEHLLARQPKQLGAGHQQLVQAARALVRVPEVFLMDEPLARLDAHLRIEMRQEFRLLQDGYGVTMVFVTNDQEEAMVMAHRVIVLDDGKIQQTGAPLDLYREPGSKFVAQFIGSPPMAFLTARLSSDAPGFWVSFGDFRVRAWAPTLADAGETIEVGVRAEDVIESTDGVPVEVGRGYFLGDHGFVRVQLAPDRWAEMRTEGVPPPTGSIINVRLRHLHLFDPVTGRAVARIEDAAT